MKFGLCYIADYHPDFQGSYAQWYDGMLEEIVRADELGYDGAWLAEHHIPAFAFGSPAVFLAAAARQTRRIRLGTAVSLLPLNDPIRLAEDYAMVDVLSKGRLDFGAGRGLYKYDYDTCRVDMSESKERFDENLEIIRRAWTEEDFSYRGRWTAIEHHTVTPRPLQQPHPPIWVAAVMTRDSFRWAGSHGFNLQTAPFFYTHFADMQERLAIYRDSLREHGHDPAQKEVLAVYHMYCAESAAEVAAVADPAMKRFQQFGKAVDERRHAYRDPRAYQDWKGFYENRQTISFDQMKETRAVLGTPEECRAKIRMLTEAYGMNYLIFEVNFGGLPHENVMRSLELFAREVMPAFGDAPV
ncbi:MAG TPA: LLM class flavin-dependent oxidoreductase [Dehalococcoidia bacterium]|nr:LLM class flavin-dependent oxidoreductase [Dehalococcoidia bacterium]